ncbi:CUB domain-containing protein 2-like [Ptychodera flava]|uniref:CUB domain-containing protein 2-like n=1 Tax=Ptychodera flava TaxID=63121 RepID=UPI00396A077E
MLFKASLFLCVMSTFLFPDQVVGQDDSKTTEPPVAVGLGCGGSFTDDNGVISSPDYGENQTTFPDCFYLIKANESTDNHVLITFLNIPGYPSYNIRVYDGSSQSDTLIGPFSGKGVPPPITSTGNSLLVHYHYDDGLPPSYNFFNATYDTTASAPACGGIFSEPAGAIHSPNYPHDYIKHQVCHYFIAAPPSTGIMLNFEDWDLMYGDEVTVHDGLSDKDAVLGEYSYGTLDNVMTSTNSALYVKFEATENKTKRGFYARYTRNTCKETTYGTFDEGYFKTPSYPYPSDWRFHRNTCNYLSFATNDATIQLEFVDFDMESSRTYLLIYDGADDTAPLIGNYTGDTAPPTINSTGSYLHMYYYGEHDQTNRGFYAVYRNGPITVGGNFSVCDNSMVYGYNGFLNSHATYPSNYPTNQQCSTVIVPAFFNAAIKFLKLDLANLNQTDDCIYGDALYMYDVYGLAGRALCSNDVGKVIEGRGNITLLFKTYQHTGNHSGFHAYFTVYLERNAIEDPCGATSFFKCQTTIRCIKDELKCNGYDDCGDMSDEQNCDKGFSIPLVFGCAALFVVFVIALLSGIAVICKRRSSSTIPFKTMVNE